MTILVNVPVTNPLDFFLASFVIFDFAGFICVVLFISGKQYAGSSFVYQQGLPAIGIKVP
jgi:hypothetical protein